MDIDLFFFTAVLDVARADISTLKKLCWKQAFSKNMPMEIEDVHDTVDGKHSKQPPDLYKI